MSLKYIKVKRKILNGDNAGTTKVYGMAKASSVSDINRMCELISARSTVSSADVKGVLDSLNWAMDFELRSGNSVQLGELGNFRLSISTDGTDTEDEFDANKIRKVRIIFTPGTALKTALGKVTFTPENVKTVVEECEKPHAI